MNCPNCAAELPTNYKLSSALSMFVCVMCKFCWVGRAAGFIKGEVKPDLRAGV